MTYVEPVYDTHPLFPLEDGQAEHRDIVLLVFKRRNAEGKLIGLPGSIPAKDVRSWADVARWWGGGHYRVIARDANGHFAGEFPAGDKLHVIHGPALPFTRDRVLAAVPTDASLVDDPPEEEGSGGEAKPAVKVVVKAVCSGILPAGLDCYIGDDGGRYLSQRGIISSIRTSKTPRKTTGGEDGKLGPYLAHLPNVSEELTTGGEVEIRIPIDKGGYRVAIGRPASFLIAFLSRYVDAFARGALHYTQVPIAHRAAALLAAFAEKGIEAMVDEACGLLVRGAPGAPPPDELRTMMREEIAVALERTRAMLREETRWASSPASIDLKAMLASSSALPWRAIKEIAKKAQVDPKTAQKRLLGGPTRRGTGARIDAALQEIMRSPAGRAVPSAAVCATPPSRRADAIGEATAGATAGSVAPEARPGSVEATGKAPAAGAVIAELDARGLLAMVENICRVRDVGLELLCGNTVRSHRVTGARHEAWWTVRNHPDRRYTCEEIGRIFARHRSAIEEGIAAHARRLAASHSPR